MLANGRPCLCAVDVHHLLSRLTQKKSKDQMKAALQGEIHYQNNNPGKGKEAAYTWVSSRTSTGPHHMLDPDVAVPVDAASNHPSKEHSPVVCCCPSNHILTAALSVMMKILKLLVHLFLSPDRESGLQSTLKPCSMPDRCMIQQRRLQ